MIQYQDILDNSKNHPVGDGKIARFETPTLIVSIVGGDRRLYGDFVETFEVAIIDKETKNFITNYFYPEYCKGDDVIPHLSLTNTLEVLNQMIKK